MFCAVSTACLYPLETEKSLDILLNLGIRQFEVFANCESEFSDDFVSNINSKLLGYGAEVCSVHLYTSGFEPFMFFTNYPRRYYDSLSLYSRYFEKAACLGAKAVVFHGDRKEGNLPLEKYCERYEALFESAQREGVILAQENVARCKSRSASMVSGMRRLLGDKVKFVLDVKQALRAGESPMDMCDAMGENIVLVHLSDSTEKQDCLLPGKGKYSIGDFILKLKGYGYKGPLIIEVYRDNYIKYKEIADSQSFVTKEIDKTA